jgi:hypothetical protein
MVAYLFISDTDIPPTHIPPPQIPPSLDCTPNRALDPITNNKWPDTYIPPSLGNAFATPNMRRRNSLEPLASPVVQSPKAYLSHAKPIKGGSTWDWRYSSRTREILNVPSKKKLGRFKLAKMRKSSPRRPKWH